MVSHLVGSFHAAAQSATQLLAVAEQASKPLIERLDPVSRTKVVMALLALVLVGLGLVLLTILGGRHLRKIARHSPAKTPEHEDDWYRKPAIPPEPTRPTPRDPE